MNRSKVTIYETLNNNKQTYAVIKEDLVKSHDLHILFGIIGGFIIIFLILIGRIVVDAITLLINKIKVIRR